MPAPARLAAAVLGVLLLGATAARDAADSNEIAVKPPAYLGTPACVECHDAEAVAWAGSHHDWALRPATPESVLGDFDDANLTHFGITSRFYRRDGGYFVETEGPDDKLAEFEILYAVGVTPLQQYLVALEGGRLQALSLAWDVPGKRRLRGLPRAGLLHRYRRDARKHLAINTAWERLQKINCDTGQGHGP